MFHGIGPSNTVFVLLSFEGPDIYSQAGGLGVRVTELSRALAQQGYETHLFFVGDPVKPGHEVGEDGRWHLHRWSQWLSASYPNGVYDGEDAKLTDVEASLPVHVVDEIVRPAILQDKICVILAEEWHTATTVVALHHLLRWTGMRERCIMFWNANNTFGFGRIPWEELAKASTITTVSRYMKHKMWALGFNSLVIPNGIPSRLLEPQVEYQVFALRHHFLGGPFLAKVGRFDPDKRWLMAIDAMAELKKREMNPRMIVRGGLEPHRIDVYTRAHLRGLSWAEVEVDDPSFESVMHALGEHPDADVLELRFFVPEVVLRSIYGAADAVFANSGHEPFGLVGLEVMACGGIAFTGCTGEDYAQSFHNAVVVDSEDSREIAVYVEHLMANPEEKERIRVNAQQTARCFTWNEVIKELHRKLEFAAQVGGVTLAD